jgi:hypothetical protein
MTTFIAICSGIAALYVLVEVGTAIYILRNRETAIPRIRASLRYILGLDTDRELTNSFIANVNDKVEDTNYRIRNATVDNSSFQEDVANQVVGKILELRNKKVGAKVRQLTKRR